MMLPDVNVLVNAFRADHSQHVVCARWLNELTQAGSHFGVSRLILAAVVRICTNARIFRQPSTPAETFRFCERLQTSGGAVAVEAGPTHWRIFSQLCTSLDIRGPDVTDAWYAALAIESDCEWVTLDRGFARFPGLRWRSP